MASAALVCGICDLRHVTKSSAVWCPECDEGFCCDCVEHHSLAKLTRHHKTIPIADYQKLPTDVLQIPQSCTQHDEKFLLYCKDHEMLCCGICAIEDHKRCKEVVNLDDIIKNVKTSTSFQFIEETLAEVVDNIKEIHKSYRGNINTLSENRKQIEKHIQAIRFKIDTHLNQIQKKLIEEIQEVEETEIKKVRQLVKKLEEKENHLTNYQNTIANIKLHASNLKTFMSIKQIEQELTKEEEFIQSCVKEDAVNTSVITCSIDKSIETIMTSIQRFGEIEIKPTKITVRRSKKRQAQIVVPKLQTKSIENVTARFKQTIKTTSQNVRGCCIIPDGRMAFTCYDSHILILIKVDGSKDFEINLPGAVDVANGNIDNTVIVSSNNAHNKTGFSITDIQYRKIRKFIPIEYRCYGLVVKNDNVIFCTDSELKILNIPTESINTITNVGISPFSYVDTNGINIYYTSLSVSESTVNCCDFKGDIKWTIKDSIMSPLGISLHDCGFLIVLSPSSVALISPSGKQSKKIFSEGLLNAQALHYDKSREMLLVANNKKSALLYKLD